MLDFCEEYFRVWNSIKSESQMVLATTRHNYPSARTVNVVVYLDKIYFQTDLRMEKAKEIKENPHVALCIGKYQIQGNCREIGHPLECKNEWFASTYKSLFPQAYNKYSNLKNERVYEVSPTKIYVWKSNNSGQTIEIISIDNRSVEMKTLSER